MHKLMRLSDNDCWHLSDYSYCVGLQEIKTHRRYDDRSVVFYVDYTVLGGEYLIEMHFTNADFELTYGFAYNVQECIEQLVDELIEDVTAHNMVKAGTRQDEALAQAIKEELPKRLKVTGENLVVQYPVERHIAAGIPMHIRVGDEDIAFAPCKRCKKMHRAGELAVTDTGQYCLACAAIRMEPQPASKPGLLDGIINFENRKGDVIALGSEGEQDNEICQACAQPSRKVYLGLVGMHYYCRDCLSEGISNIDRA